MPTATNKIIKNCMTGEEIIETYHIPDPTPEELAAQLATEQQKVINEISRKAQQRLDTFAATRRYDGVDSVGKYKDLTDAEIATLPPEEQVIVSRYREECRYLALVTSYTWAVLENIYNSVMNGTRIAPTCYEDIEAELPTLTWP